MGNNNARSNSSHDPPNPEDPNSQPAASSEHKAKSSEEPQKSESSSLQRFMQSLLKMVSSEAKQDSAETSASRSPAQDGEDQQQPSSSSDEQLYFTVDDAVSKAGYGKFQKWITFLTGLSWMADGFEVMVLTIIGDFLACQKGWTVYNYENSLMSSIAFCGMTIGAPIFGKISDKYGRKTSLAISLLLLFIFGFSSAFSNSMTAIIVLRGFMGFALGGIAQSMTLCTEYHPVATRGTSSFYLCYFWAVGTLGVILVAWLVTRIGGTWRHILIVVAMPALVVLLSMVWYPESARYYAVSNQYDKAVEVLQRMANMNKVDLPPGRLVEIKESDMEARGRIMDLFAPQHRKSSLLYFYIWFAVAYSYYGISFIMPEIIKKGHLAVDNASNTTNVMTCKEGNTPFVDKDYINLIWTNAAEIPGLIVFMVLVGYVKRKTLLSVSCGINAILTLLLLMQVDMPVLMNVILFLAKGNAVGFFQLLYLMTAESFPTTIRGVVLGTCSCLSRIGGIVVPFGTQMIINTHPVVSIIVLALVTFLAAVCACFLPRETMGQPLRDLTASPTVENLENQPKV